MPFRERLKIFAIGFLVGCALVMVILQNRGTAERERTVPATAEARREAAVPGLRKAYEERGLPLESRFIIDESVEPTAERGVHLRTFILRGEFSGQLLRVQEWISGYGSPRARVVAWRVMAADELWVTLKAGVAPHELAPALQSVDFVLKRRGQAPDSVMVGLPDSGLEAVPAGIARLEAFGQWVQSVAPNFLDKSDNEAKTQGL